MSDGLSGPADMEQFFLLGLLDSESDFIGWLAVSLVNNDVTTEQSAEVIRLQKNSISK